MRILKPQHLSVLHRCFEQQRKTYLGISVMAFMPLQSEIALLPEQELWQFVPPLLNPETPLDAAFPKPGGEFLVVGNACAPQGQPVTELQVGARVGNLTKVLNVYGPRHWTSRHSSEPQPFLTQPIDWAHAYGGQKFDTNPIGTGMTMIETPQRQLQPLPSVEYPRSPSLSPKTTILPASFAPVPPMWPQRKRFDGTYDNAWLKHDYPGIPEDFNRRFLCLASEDQWQQQAFNGNETIELVHWHPDHPHIHATLPGIKPVVAVRMKNMSANELHLAEPTLTTLWFFPNQLRMVLIWHALVPVEDAFADDVNLLLAAAEWIRQPKSPAHYIQAVIDRLDDDKGVLKMLDDEELLPEGIATPDESLKHYERALGTSGASMENVHRKLEEAQRELAAQLSQALAPEQWAPDPEEAIKSQEQLAALTRELGIPELPRQFPDDPKEMLKLAREIEQQIPPMPVLKKKLDGKIADIDRSIREELASVGQDKEQIEALFKPKKPSQDSVSLNQMVKEFDEMSARIPMSSEFLPVTDPKLKALAMQADEALAPMLRAAAHFQDPPEPLDAATKAHWRERALHIKARTEGFARCALKSADFSGLDLSGVDFTEAELQGANFTGAILVGANFRNASLAHAVLDDAKLDNASFAGANLGRARLVGASCVDCDFADATLHYTALEGARFDRSRLPGATLIEVTAGKSVWCEANLTEANFIKCQLPHVNFARTKLSGASFIETDLQSCDFSGAALKATAFVTCMLDDSIFDSCQASNIRFVHGSSLRRTSFKDAIVSNASFRAMPLDNADFTAACLDGSDLSEIQCPNGNFYRASLKDALLMKAHCQKACFVGANLMQVIAQYAHLEGADFSDANLFASDLMRIETDSATRFDDAFMAKSRRHPTHKLEKRARLAVVSL
ncbi:MAG: DUF2169 domain-containing protein [Gammaproteobacteria bacterium]|nr:DUF2169 domain-containing protein [Gammaproteobacteria bacterium]